MTELINKTQPVLSPGLSVLSDVLSRLVGLTGSFLVAYAIGMSGDWLKGFWVGGSTWLMQPVYLYFFGEKS